MKFSITNGERLNQSALLAKAREVRELPLSEFRFEREYQEAVIAYVRDVMREVMRGVSRKFGVDPDSISKSVTVPVADLIKAAKAPVWAIPDALKALLEDLSDPAPLHDYYKRYGIAGKGTIKPMKLGGRTFTNPETGTPMTEAQWKEMETGMVEFLRENLGDIGDEMGLRAGLLGMLRYSYGAVEGLDREGLKNLSLTQVSDKFKDGLPRNLSDTRDAVDMGPVMRRCVEQARQSAGQYLSIKDGTLRRGIVDAVRKVVTGSIEDGAGPSTLASRLFHIDPQDALGGKYSKANLEYLQRDWRRIAITEMSTAMNNGFLAAVLDATEKGEKAYVVYSGPFYPPEGAGGCNQFIGNIYLLVADPSVKQRQDDRIGIELDPWATGVTWIGKNNIGRKMSQWWAAIPSHPCFIDPTIPVFTSKGWMGISKIRVGDLVLTHQGRFRRVTQVHRGQETRGYVQLHVLAREKGSYTHRRVILRSTFEHPFLTSKGWVDAKDLCKGDKVRVLAKRCKVCGKLIMWSDAERFDSNDVCSASCRSTLSMRRTWEKPEYRAIKKGQMGEIVQKRYASTSKEDRRKITEAARVVARRKMAEFNWLNTPESRRKLMQSCAKGAKGSPLEVRFAKALDQVGIGYERQFPVRRFFADFRVSGTNVLIECDGEYWHLRQKEYDAKRQREIEAEGFRVLRFSGTEITKGVDSCVEEVQRVVANDRHEYEFTDVEVSSVRVVRFSQSSQHRTTYNLAVENDESYIVRGCVVHNCCRHWWEHIFPDEEKYDRVSGKIVPAMPGEGIQQPEEFRYTPEELAYEPEEKSLWRKALDLFKARPGLVKRKVLVHRAGKTFYSDRWIKPGEEPATESAPAETEQKKGEGRPVFRGFKEVRGLHVLPLEAQNNLERGLNNLGEAFGDLGDFLHDKGVELSVETSFGFNREAVRGDFVPSDNVIHIRRDSQETIGHEIGHAVDYHSGVTMMRGLNLKEFDRQSNEEIRGASSLPQKVVLSALYDEVAKEALYSIDMKEARELVDAWLEDARKHGVKNYHVGIGNNPITAEQVQKWLSPDVVNRALRPFGETSPSTEFVALWDKLAGMGTVSRFLDISEYIASPMEVWARCFEQFAANKTRKEGGEYKAGAVHPYGHYLTGENLPEVYKHAYLTDEEFGKVEPLIRACITKSGLTLLKSLLKAAPAPGLIQQQIMVHRPTGVIYQKRWVKPGEAPKQQAPAPKPDDIQKRPDGFYIQHGGRWLKVGKTREQAEEFIRRRHEHKQPEEKKPTADVGETVRISAAASGSLGRGIVGRVKEIGEGFARIVDEAGRTFRVPERALAYAKAFEKSKRVYVSPSPKHKGYYRTDPRTKKAVVTKEREPKKITPKSVLEDLKQEIGTTQNWKEAIYLLPDGVLLAGRRIGEPSDHVRTAEAARALEEGHAPDYYGESSDYISPYWFVKKYHAVKLSNLGEIGGDMEVALPQHLTTVQIEMLDALYRAINPHKVEVVSSLETSGSRTEGESDLDFETYIGREAFQGRLFEKAGLTMEEGLALLKAGQAVSKRGAKFPKIVYVKRKGKTYTAKRWAHPDTVLLPPGRFIRSRWATLVDLLKAGRKKDNPKLIRKKIMVTRTGKTFIQTVLVDPTKDMPKGGIGRGTGEPEGVKPTRSEDGGGTGRHRASERAGAEVAVRENAPVEAAVRDDPKQEVAVTDYREFLPDVKAKLRPEFRKMKDGRSLYPHQIEGAERILEGLAVHGGYLLMDEPGLGKTNVVLAAVAQVKPERAILVVSVGGKQAQLVNWKDSAMSLGLKLRTDIEKANDPNEKGIWVCAYDDVSRNEGFRKGGQFDLVSFDECQALKTWDTQQSYSSKVLMNRVKYTIYSSATPFTNVMDMHYLTNLGLVAADKMREDLYDVKNQKDEKTGKEQGWPKALSLLRIDPSFKQFMKDNGCILKESKDYSYWENPEDPRRMVEINARIRTMGHGIQRRANLSGLHTSFETVPITPEQEKVYESGLAIFDDIREDMHPRSMTYKLVKAFEVAWSRHYLEYLKLPRAVELAQEALKKGRRPILFTAYVQGGHAHLNAAINSYQKYNTPRSGPNAGETPQSVLAVVEKFREQMKNLPDIPPIASELVKHLGGAGKVAEIHGGAEDQNSAREQDRFNKGEKKVAVATIDKGGTGLSFHDTVGNAPRTQINVTLPWSADKTTQVMGRSHRLGSKSATEMKFLLADVQAEHRLGAVVSKRMESLGALVSGRPKADFKEALKEFFEIGSAILPMTGMTQELQETYREAAQYWLGKREKGEKYITRGEGREQKQERKTREEADIVKAPTKAEVNGLPVIPAGMPLGEIDDVRRAAWRVVYPFEKDIQSGRTPNSIENQKKLQQLKDIALHYEAAYKARGGKHQPKPGRFRKSFDMVKAKRVYVKATAKRKAYIRLDPRERHNPREAYAAQQEPKEEPVALTVRMSPVLREVVNRVGTTTDWHKAIFLLPNGTMLAGKRIRPEGSDHQAVSELANELLLDAGEEAFGGGVNAFIQKYQAVKLANLGDMGGGLELSLPYHLPLTIEEITKLSEIYDAVNPKRTLIYREGSGVVEVSGKQEFLETIFEKSMEEIVSEGLLEKSYFKEMRR